MAVTNKPVQYSYATDGVTKAFAFASYFIAQADLRVTFTDASGVQTTKTLNSDYSVSGVVDSKLGVYSAGGTVTFNVPPAAGGTVLIARQTQQIQAAIYNPQDPFPAGAHEAALDRQTLISQEAAAGYKGFALRAPTAGTYAVGDWYRNPAPVPGGTFGWVCTVAGTPGTWNEFGAISL